MAKSKKTRTLANRLKYYRTLIFNSSDKEIAPILAGMGADRAYVDQGEALYNEALALVEQQRKEYQEQSQAYDKFNEERDEVKNAYDRTLKVVRNFARYDENLTDRLNLQNGKSIALEKWFENAIRFYNRVLNEPDFLSQLANYNVTPKKLKLEQQSIRDLKVLRDAAISEKGQAQEATRLRNEKLDALDDYSTDLRTLAELALEEQPQLMEKLGILVRSD